MDCSLKFASHLFLLSSFLTCCVFLRHNIFCVCVPHNSNKTPKALVSTMLQCLHAEFENCATRRNRLAKIDLNSTGTTVVFIFRKIFPFLYRYSCLCVNCFTFLPVWMHGRANPVPNLKLPLINSGAFFRLKIYEAHCGKCQEENFITPPQSGVIKLV